jgi:high affinity cAMP-specific and IBMX-insensitive 3',5'-cyclic phosphodiesterase 8
LCNGGVSLSQRKRSYDIRSNALFDGLPMATRRHSMARVHTNSVEAPITKAINIISQAQEKTTNDIVKQSLDHAIEILRSAELYNPVNTLHENDKHTSALVSGLMSVSVKNKTELTYKYIIH